MNEEEKMTSIYLLQGKSPSELGLEFEDAGELLSRYQLLIEEQLQIMEKTNEDNLGKKLTLARVFRKTRELAQIFIEADILTRPPARQGN